VKRILLVDDDREIVKSTAQLLQAFGYEVTVCVDADRVVEMMHSQRPDVVLHDVRMPGLDLRAQVRAIRDDPLVAGVPIVLFTAVLSAKELAEEVGADDAIKKPFSSETLRQVLRDCEGRPRKPKSRLRENEQA
jgi:two-component system alkaline phosphatase synthesis response regulator PhoP